MFNGKKVVGIVPKSPVFGRGENAYGDAYTFADTYVTRAKEAGLLPVGVLPVNERISTDVPDLCDAFIIQGGAGVRPFHLDLIDHAVKNGKKVLGICLGCQAIHTYFSVREILREQGLDTAPGDYYADVIGNKNIFLEGVEGHRPFDGLPRGDLDWIKHPVKLDPDSNLARILGVTEVQGASIHVYRIKTPAPGEKVTGRAEDGTVEVIEVGDKIIGTQFHPDVDSLLHRVFDWLGE